MRRATKPLRNDDDEPEPTVIRDTIDLYFLDSSNIEFLELADREIPDFVNRRVKDKEILNIKLTDLYAIK